jgi:hypothetical protein
MKKTKNIFAQKRLVYFAQEKAEAAVSAAQKETTERIGGIEAALKSGKNVEQATEAAKFFIREAGRNATTKLEQDWELRKDAKEYQNYLDKVKSMTQKALDEIEKNRARYEQIAAFIAKKTEMEDLLKRNADGFKRQVQGRNDVKQLSTLEETAKELANTQAEINAMVAPGMEKDRDALGAAIETQINDFLAEADATRAFHKKQLEDAYQTLVDAAVNIQRIQAEDKEVTTVAGDRGFSDAQARTAWLQLSYLKALELDLSSAGGEKDLNAGLEQAKPAAKNIEPLLNWWEQKHSPDRNSQESNDRRQAWEALPKLLANVNRAKEQVAKTEAQGATGKEKNDAAAWLAGATEAYNKSLQQFNGSIRAVQRGTNELEYGESGPERVSRVGFTDQGKAEAMVAEVMKRTGTPAKPYPAEENKEEETTEPELVARAKDKKKREKKA